MSYSDYIARQQLTHQLAAALKRAEAAEERANNLNDGWLKAIEQRDDARTKLAELEKQEVYAFGNRYTNMPEESPNFSGSIFNKSWGDYTKPLFTHPAPAVSLRKIEEAK